MNDPLSLPQSNLVTLRTEPRTTILFNGPTPSITLQKQDIVLDLKNKYARYLGIFNVPPPKDLARWKPLIEMFEQRLPYYSLRVPSGVGLLEMKQAVRYFLLSRAEALPWEWYTTQELVEQHFDKEASMDSLSQFNSLVIIHTGKEIQHTYNLELTQQIVGFRQLTTSHATLFICPSETAVSRGMNAINPFNDEAIPSASQMVAMSGESSETPAEPVVPATEGSAPKPDDLPAYEPTLQGPKHTPSPKKPDPLAN